MGADRHHLHTPALPSFGLPLSRQNVCCCLYHGSSVSFEVHANPHYRFRELKFCPPLSVGVIRLKLQMIKMSMWFRISQNRASAPDLFL